MGSLDEELEWNDAPSQPSASPAGSRSNAVPSAYATKSVVDWAREESDVSAKILLCLLDGMTPSQAAKECRVPNNSIDALLSYGIARKPVLREDQYAYAFKTYAISLNEFIDIYGQPARTYRYLTLAYKPGKRAIEGMLGDQQIPDSAKLNLSRRLKRQGSQQSVAPSRKADKEPSPKKALPTIDDSYASRIIAKTDISLLEVPQKEAPVTRVQHRSPSKSDVQRKTLLHKEKVPEKPRNSTARRIKYAIPERSDYELKQLRDAVLGIAKRDTEYSVKHFYIKLSGLMSEMSILSPSQLYDELMQAFMGSPDVEFCENLLIRFGNANHDKQILSLMKDLSVSNPSRIVWLYRDQYGVDFPLIRKWLLDFSDYQNDSGMYDYEFGQSQRRLKGTQIKTDESTERRAQTKPGSTPKLNKAELQPAAARSRPDARRVTTSSRSGAGLSNSDKERLRFAVLQIAEDNTEYSTVYFYKALPDIAKSLKATTSRRFNSLFAKAFEDYEGVSLTSGFLVEFGTCDRRLQILRLIEELSPIRRGSLCREYEKRYGVSLSTMSNWVRRYAGEYCRGDYYSIKYGPKITASGAVSSAESARRSAVIKRLRKAVREHAQVGIEYSTDHFYTVFPQLVTELNVKDEAEFYRVVKEAFKDSSVINFSSLRSMSFGEINRERQLFELMKEMSPVTGEDLSLEYERRYGFSWYLVQWWLRKFSEYESDGLYQISTSEETLEALEKTSGLDTEKATREDKVEPVEVPSADNLVKLRSASPKSVNTDGGDTDAPVSKTEKKVEAPKIRKAQTSTASSPMTALDWALSLGGVTRQVVQQILFGNTLPDVAARASLSLAETTSILETAFKGCPRVREDSFLINFRLCKSKWDFCNSTGEPESTYSFLYWRMRANGDSIYLGASDQSPRLTQKPSGGRVSNQSETSLRRREMREAARAELRREKHGVVDQGVTTNDGLDIEEPMVAVFGDEKSPSGQAPMGKSSAVNVANKRAGYSDTGAHLERQMTYEVNRLAKLNKEYAAAFFFNALPDLMAKYDIKSDRDLFAYLRRAYRRDPDVTFLGSDVIRFGKCNRSRQVNQFCLERPSLDVDTFVKEYGAQYGFDAVRVTKWVDKYHLDLLPSKKQRAVQVDSHQIRRANAVAKQRNSEYESFLRSELNGDCCDRRLIAERFRAKFPNGPDDPFTQEMLYRLGYKAKGKKLLFKEDINYNDYFENLIDTHVLFARGDKGFEDAVFNDPQFRQVLRRRMRSYDVIEYEKGSFIDTCHLCEQMGVSIDDVFSYSQDVVRQLREIQGVPVPFTIWSLRNRYHIQHPLDVLATEGGMSDYLFETLFDIDPHVQCCTLAGIRGFLESEGAFVTSNFIECLIEMNGPMEFDDLLYLLKDAYGIDYPELPLHRAISASSLYYDDITDSVFNSRHEWEEMINRELA